MAYRQRVGRWGEEIAQAFLEKRGLIPVASNLRTQYGEIDLIMQDGNAIVFIEVKTRSNRKYGLPEASINRQKQMHIKQAAEFMMQEHPDWGESWRIDVLAISGRPGDLTPEILWFVNAVV